MMARIQNAVVVAIASVVIDVAIAMITAAIVDVNEGVDLGPLPATATIAIAIPVGAKTGMAGSLVKSSARGLNWLG